MGVKYLTSYVKGKVSPRLLENPKTEIVVLDGSSLLYYGISKFGKVWCCQPSYSELYDYYMKYLEWIQLIFKRVYLVVESSSETHKLECHEKRQTDQVSELVEKFSTDTPKITPILANLVFLNCLYEFRDSLQLISSLYCEADSHAALLARQLGAYVISLDSDFFIYDIKGYIPLDYIKGKEFVQYFKRDDIANHFGIGPHQLPLLATFLGNDYVENQVVTPKTLMSSISTICQVLKESANERIIEQVEKLRNQLGCEIDDKDVLFSMSTYGLKNQMIISKSLKDVVIENYCSFLWDSRIISILVDKVFWCKVHYENPSQKTSWNVSRPLRGHIYSILATLTTDSITCITEYVRIGSDLVKDDVHISGSPLSSYEKMIRLSKVDKWDFIIDTLEIGTMNIRKGLEFLIPIKYFQKHATISTEESIALISMFLRIPISEKLQNETISVEKSSVQRMAQFQTICSCFALLLFLVFNDEAHMYLTNLIKKIDVHDFYLHLRSIKKNGYKTGPYKPAFLLHVDL